ncbi:MULTISPECIES: hypothetical protein [unclassified Sinorhizobium]|uniref:hypothetical protein n=1 Tax=unclassified Sinorhizobium TaxID=2613772 RepID=UPI0035257086
MKARTSSRRSQMTKDEAGWHGVNEAEDHRRSIEENLNVEHGLTPIALHPQLQGRLLTSSGACSSAANSSVAAERHHCGFP